MVPAAGNSGQRRAGVSQPSLHDKHHYPMWGRRQHRRRTCHPSSCQRLSGAAYSYCPAAAILGSAGSAPYGTTDCSDNAFGAERRSCQTEVSDSSAWDDSYGDRCSSSTHHNSTSADPSSECWQYSSTASCHRCISPEAELEADGRVGHTEIAITKHSHEAIGGAQYYCSDANAYCTTVVIKVLACASLPTGSSGNGDCKPHATNAFESGLADLFAPAFTRRPRLPLYPEF
mmetsp:Transcript_67517/g.174893  ORF Transcript_67517/g.174893 Transcript_67517/m.174893 type:complete len:231 (+) Transcript_67517:91-783(+)